MYTPGTWLPRGRQVEERNRASGTVQHRVGARHVGEGPFQAVEAGPSLSLPRPRLSHCLGCNSRRGTSSLSPGILEAAEEPHRYHEIIALGT